MKMFLMIVVPLTAFARFAYSQGHVAFNNYGAGLAPVTITTLPGMFNPTNGIPGAFVGSDYTASLFWISGTVTNQSEFDSLNPMWAADTRFFGTTGTGPGHGIDGDLSGFFDGGAAFLINQQSFNVTLQVRAWYNGNGLYTGYAQALAAGQNIGHSNLLPLNVSPPPGGAVQLYGLEPFTVGIPEPSTLLLAVLGGVAFVFLRRRIILKRSRADVRM